MKNPHTHTHRQIRAAIAPRLSDDDDAVAALGALSSAALGGGGGGKAGKTSESPATAAVVVAAANSVWARPPLSFSPTFLSRAAALHASTHALSTAAAINAWCASATAGRICDAVDEGAVAPAVAVLVNALYFKAAWAAPFQPALSRAGAFYAEAPTEGEEEGGGSGRTVLMEAAHFMARPADKAARLLDAPGACRALRLAYGGGEEGEGGAAAGEYEAVVVLPAAGAAVGAALAAVEGAFAAEEEEGEGDGSASAAPDTPRWHRPLAGVDIHLPAFTVDAGVALGPHLRALGVRAAFGEGPGGADFSEMLQEAPGGDNPRRPVGSAISEVIHRVWIATDEAGTEAAAVTAVVMVRAMLARPAVFIADHPFLFGVRHSPSGAWLFLGRVGTPKAWSGGVEGSPAAADAGVGVPGCGGGAVL
jgi:serpin B